MRIVLIIADDRDAKNDVCADEPVFGPAPAALLEGFRAAPEADVHVVSCVRRPLRAPDKLAGYIFYHQVPVSRGYRRTFFVEAIQKVRAVIREIDPDVVHGQGTEDYQGVCAAFSGCPNCITIHGNMRAVARKLNYQPFPAMTITALAESAALRKTGAVICNSLYTERCVGRLNENKVRIPNAVRSSFFDLAERRTARNSQLTAHSLPTLLCIGDILSYKNQIGLIEALDHFPNIGTFKLLFAGSCRDDGYGRKFLEAVSSRSWCEYAGRLELDELQKLLSCCAGVIHPTLEDSFGLAVAEAQAAGVPVAASAVGGIPDLIKHGETGLLFNPHDPEDIRRQVMQLLDRTVAEKLAQKARIFAEAEYRPGKIAGKHIRLYEGLLQ